MKLFSIILAVCMMSAFAAVASADEVQPVAMSNRAVGGAALNSYTPGVENGAGANNVGLLIKTWGRVTWVDAANKFFYIDDGSALKDGSTHIDGTNIVENVGVRVSYSDLASGNTIDPPSVGDHTVITCISSTVIINDKVQPNLRPRRQADIS
jgi:hypothetical protein